MTTSSMSSYASAHAQPHASAAASSRFVLIAAIILSFGIATGSLWRSDAAMLPLQIAFHIAASTR